MVHRLTIKRKVCLCGINSYTNWVTIIRAFIIALCGMLFISSKMQESNVTVIEYFRLETCLS